VNDAGWNSLYLLFSGFVIYHQIFINVGSVAALMVGSVGVEVISCTSVCVCVCGWYDGQG